MPKPKTPTSFEPVKRLGYSVGSMIGQGGFGSVYLATHEPSNTHRAVKAIAKGDVDRREIENEIDMMMRTDHAKNVAKLLDVSEDTAFYFICLEACMGGHLLKRLTRHRQFTERHAAVAIADVLSALSVLHGMGIAHRDIKPQNLIYFDERPDAPLKVIDFGLAVDLRKEPNGKVDEFAGTIRFMSPSVVKRRMYGCECDLWAVGVTAFLLLSGGYPFNGSSVDEVAALIADGAYDLHAKEWANVSADGRHFVSQLLRDPYLEEQRGKHGARPGELLTVFDALEHPWIRHRGAQSATQLDEGVRQRLIGMHNRNLLDAAVGNLMAARLQPKDINVLLAQFDLLDTNGDGHVTLDEYLQGVASLEVTYDDLRKQFAAYDTDKDGRISKQEFLSACLSQNLGEEGGAQQAESFEKLADAMLPAAAQGGADMGARGRQITPRSLAEALRAMGSDEDVDELTRSAESAIQEADLDEDGALSFDEFRAWIERRNSEPGAHPALPTGPQPAQLETPQRGSWAGSGLLSAWATAAWSSGRSAEQPPVGKRRSVSQMLVGIAPALVAVFAFGAFSSTVPR